MSYNLSWYKPDHVLYLEWVGQLSVQELETINQEIIEILNAYHHKMNILINANNFMAIHQTTNDLRNTQKYMNHPNLETAFIVSDNKLNRLITLMAFSISRTRLVQFNTMEIAESKLKRLGLQPDLRV